MKAFLIKIAAVVSFLISAAFIFVYIAGSVIFILFWVGVLSILGAIGALFSVKDSTFKESVLSEKDQKDAEQLIKEAEDRVNEWFV